MKSQTTIRVRESTRSRLRRLKAGRTYDEYIVFLMGVIKRLEAAGAGRRYSDAELQRKSRETRKWMERNSRWRKGRMVFLNIYGR